MLTKEKLIAVRDPHGFRPLAVGRLGDATIVCSETCALDLIGATYIRDVEPGEVLVISKSGMRSYKPFAAASPAHCIFEHVYFARPDSYVFGQSVNEVRTELGRVLAREAGLMLTLSFQFRTLESVRRLGMLKSLGCRSRWG